MKNEIIDQIRRGQITSIDQIDLKKLWLEWREYFYCSSYAFACLRKQWVDAKQFNDVTYLEV